jgi:molybdenum cofactor cytidylyltransferase
MVVVVSGLAGLGEPLDEEHVHRSELFSRLSGLAQGQPVSAEGLARVLLHPQGGLKNIPAGARKVVLLNQADDEVSIAEGKQIAPRLLDEYDAVLVAALEKQSIWQVSEPIGGVLLAAGASTRFGEPKMLLDWRGKPLIRHVAEAALQAGLKLVVVLGAAPQPVRNALTGLDVRFVENPDWQAGQSTSLRRGLSELAENTGAALFLLADQPLVTPEAIRALIENHNQTLAAIIAPRVAGRRANPVLFDRVTFPALASLEGDTGGRAIFDRFAVDYVDRPETGLLLDVDTPEDYQRLKGLE